MNNLRKNYTGFIILITGFCLISCDSELQKPEDLTWNEHREPQYTSDQDWAALPGRKERADELPKHLPDDAMIYDEEELPVDVFFVYPTQYFEGEWWNASLEDEAINRVTDDYPMRLQASAFQMGGRLYAPRYRQAHIGVFTWQDSTSYSSLELAYADVKAAFEHYLEHWNNGRKIILAGHSQGSWHLRWLLQEFFDGQPLQSQLIAAYGPGFDWYASDFQNIPPCTSPAEVGCVCSWMTYGGTYRPDWLGYKNEESICTHPVTWTADSACNLKSDHAGVVLSKMKFSHEQSLVACINEGILSLSEPDVPFGKRLQRENWHIGDINLFWLNIRSNARQRALAGL
tara:strand:+ start:5824 stop:6855 length:1032 start_codon:yes stop_codon:yes gene_type:complete